MVEDMFCPYIDEEWISSSLYRAEAVLSAWNLVLTTVLEVKIVAEFYVWMELLLLFSSTVVTKWPMHYDSVLFT